MRFVFKTQYEQDTRIWKHSGYLWTYGILIAALIIFPAVNNVIDIEFFVGEATLWLVYSIAGVGLMVSIGFTGQMSLGHAAFLGIGAYTNAYLLTLGMPSYVTIPAAVVLAAVAGVAIGLPTLRMHGIYLAIATFSFLIIVEHIMAKWETVTGGFNGLAVEAPTWYVPFMPDLRYEMYNVWEIYYLALALLILTMWGVLNLLRSPTGRAFVAIRDSEVSAQSMGINLAWYKTLAFAVSAGITGLAGAVMSYQLTYLAPDAFNIFESIKLLLIVVVGGVGSIHGGVMGAAFIVALPQFLAILRDFLISLTSDTAFVAVGRFMETPGLEAGVFGAILVLVIIFEPLGLYGRWVKIRTYFELFPMYKKATFKRQKSYLKTERLR